MNRDMLIVLEKIEQLVKKPVQVGSDKIQDIIQIIVMEESEATQMSYF
jgi:hypothetical protein